MESKSCRDILRNKIKEAYLNDGDAEIYTYESMDAYESLAAKRITIDEYLDKLTPEQLVLCFQSLCCYWYR